MVNSKKMSKSSIAVIVLALLLVLSLALGITGAWFTDRKADDGSESVQFGTVAINLDGSNVGFFDGTHKEGSEALTGKLMPGDHVDFKLQVNNTGDAAYILIKVSLAYANTANGAGQGAIDKYYTVDGNGALKELVNSAEEGKVTVVGSLAATSGTISLDEGLEFDGAVYGNDYQGATVTLNYEVRALQVKNVSAADATAYLKSASESAFDAGTGALNG